MFLGGLLQNTFSSDCLSTSLQGQELSSVQYSVFIWLIAEYVILQEKLQFILYFVDCF